MCELAGSGLVRRHADRFEKVGRLARKRRRQKQDALVSRAVPQIEVRIALQRGAGEQI
jgi:hypothetical protein